MMQRGITTTLRIKYEVIFYRVIPILIVYFEHGLLLKKEVLGTSTRRIGSLYQVFVVLIVLSC